MNAELCVATAMSLPDDLTKTPVARASVLLPDDEETGVVRLAPLAPAGLVACRSIRWMGAGAATLWYSPATPRESWTASEQAAGVPAMLGNEQFLPLQFLSQGEEQPVQATALLDTNGTVTSTAGSYVVIY